MTHRIRLGLLICTGMSFGTLCFSVFPEDGSAAPVPTAAVEPVLPLPVPAEKVYKNKQSGDEAYRNRDFRAASGFYRKYRIEAAKSKDINALRDAFELEIDSLIRSSMASEAEKILLAYENSFIELDPVSLSLWRSHIYLLQGQLKDAEKRLEQILSEIPKNDPRRMQAVASMAFLRELQKRYKEAARLYLELADMEGSGNLAQRSLERGILMLVAAGETDEALQKLKTVPLANEKRDLLALRCLSFYLQLKKNGMKDLEKTWQELSKDRPEHKEMFFYLAASLIGENMEREKDFPHAVEAYAMAFDCAPTPETEQSTLSRMADCFSAAGDPVEAARLALIQYKLFHGAAAAPPVKLRVGALLTAAGNFKEALSVYEAVFRDPLPQKERLEVFHTAFYDLLKHKAFAEAERLTILFYKQDPASAERSMYLAEIAKETGDLQKAADLFCAAAHASSVLYEEAMFRAVKVYMELGKFEKVIQLCSSMLTRNPASPVRIYRAESYEKNKDFAKALEDYQTYLKTNDKTMTEALRAQARYRAGRILIEQGKIGNAVVYFQQIWDGGQTDFSPVAGYWLVHCSALMENEMEAETRTKALLERYPNSEYAYAAALWLASYYISGGYFDRAVTSLDLAAKQTVYPGIRVRAMYEKALLCCREKKYEDAEKIIQQIETISPDDILLSEVLFLRGDILREQKKYTEAIPAYREAAKRRPASELELAAFMFIGDCYFNQASLKDDSALYEEARKAYQTVRDSNLSLRDYKIMAHYKAARCLQILGRDEEACAEYRTLLYSLPAVSAASYHPAEKLWGVKSAEALISLAEKKPAGAFMDGGDYAVKWLEKSGVLDSKMVQKRRSILYQKKKIYLRQEIHKQ